MNSVDKNLILESNGIFQKFELHMSCPTFLRQLKIAELKSERSNYRCGKVANKNSEKLPFAISEILVKHESRAVLS